MDIEPQVMWKENCPARSYHNMIQMNVRKTLIKLHIYPLYKLL